mmetsp:Transcript_82303/g.161411  ORF Transcript_82303/g.161411 Transcript_82303/m.161411 type:complete len:320 (+) Transcript_82303:19-978(+)
MGPLVGGVQVGQMRFDAALGRPGLHLGAWLHDIRHAGHGRGEDGPRHPDRARQDGDHEPPEAARVLPARLVAAWEGIDARAFFALDDLERQRCHKRLYHSKEEGRFPGIRRRLPLRGHVRVPQLPASLVGPARQPHDLGAGSGAAYSEGVALPHLWAVWHLLDRQPWKPNTAQRRVVWRLAGSVVRRAAQGHHRRLRFARPPVHDSVLGDPFLGAGPVHHQGDGEEARLLEGPLGPPDPRARLVDGPGLRLEGCCSRPRGLVVGGRHPRRRRIHGDRLADGLNHQAVDRGPHHQRREPVPLRARRAIERQVYIPAHAQG